MSIWVELEQGRDTFITIVRSLYNYSLFADELKLSPLPHWVRVTHLATSWNRNKNSLLSGIIEDLCSILSLELNKKRDELFSLTTQAFALSAMAGSNHCLSTEDAFLLGRWSVTIYIFCFRLSWQKRAYAIFIYRDVFKTGTRRTWI